MTWLPRTNATSISEAVSILSGCNIEELKNPEPAEPWEIKNLEDAAALINTCIKAGKHISVIGDYDTDGCTSSAILYLLLKELGSTPDIRLPHRMSEGYGLSPAIVEEVREKNPDGLLITVDNGIAAKEAVQQAKDVGMTVIILDHHLPGETLPAADVLVDQWTDTESSDHGPGYCYYCGAGLAYKLAQYMIPENTTLLEKMSALAAIGTVGDVMNLTKDNRVIVKDGLAAMDAGNVTKDLQCILDASGKARFDAITLAFYVVPMINAAGRLLDDGAKLPCAILAAENNVYRHAERLKFLNDQRKELVKTQYQAVVTQLGLTPDAKVSVPLIAFSDVVHEGIAGILAGKLTEEYHVPAFVFARTKTHWKGSGRSIEGVNLKRRLDDMSDCMLGYGGHSGAAGVSVAFGDEDKFKAEAQNAFKDVEPEDVSKKYYDVVLTEDQVVSAFEEQQQLEPFGEGCPKPVVRINHCHVIPGRNGRNAFYMGKNQEHVKLKCSSFAILGFFIAEEYQKLGEPDYVDVIGQLELNISQYGKELQINAQTILPSS